MSLRESLLAALEALSANRLRAALTMLGVVIGVALVITLVSLGEAATAYVNREVGSMGFGSNALVVHPGKLDPPIEPSKLTLSDIREIQRRVPGVVDVVPVLIGSAEARFGRRDHKTAVWGLTENYVRLLNYRVEEGQFLTALDTEKHRKVCILGQTVKQKLFGEVSPVGEHLSLSGRRFLCLGVMEQKGEMLNFNMDDMVIVPVTTAQDLLDTTKVTEFVVWASEPTALPRVREQIATVLSAQHLEQDDFHFHTQAETLSILGKITGTLTMFVSGIAAVSLLVGSIGIMNIMLVSVMERTREIGIRKAVGARNRDIFLQFFGEALVISMTGGLVGILVGASAGILAMRLIGTPLVVSTWAVAAALVSSAVVGLAAGVYPAMRAARQDPIRALRFE